MKVSIIAPIHNLDISTKLSNMYMVLSWLALEEPSYKQFYIDLKQREPKSYIILDNGAAEGKLIDNKLLINLAKEMNVNEIVLPDAYGNVIETLNRSGKFIDENIVYIKENKFKLMGVVQGQTIEEFLKCYEIFLTDKDVKIIGLGYKNLLNAFIREIEAISNGEWTSWGITEIQHLINKLENNTFLYTLSRPYFIKNYVDFDQLKKRGKKIHLLGSYNSYELSLYKKMFNDKELKFIRSNDTASPCQAAQVDVFFDRTFGVVNKPKKFLDFKKKMSLKELEACYNNINIMKEWI